MNNNSKYVVLNWMLPAIPSFPSPAMSLLKSQMQAAGYDVKVVYWNFKFLPVIEHYWGGLTEEYEDHLIYFLSPIFAYWALELNDTRSIKELHQYWNKVNKRNTISEDSFLSHVRDNVSMLVNVIHQNLHDYNFEKCLFAGYYQKLFQMYGADIVAREQKKLYPKTTAVFGGIDTKDEALASMDNFPSFDYALWGEGEITLLNCASMLQGEMKKWDVGNLVWRESDKLEISKSNNKFVKLDDSVIPDYSDYFEQATIDKKKIRLPIEGSRGCHWSQCRFCFHNEGTRYRRKSPQRISTEIRSQIEKYGIYQISFLDNDTIGKDVNGFKDLLKELSCIKNDYPEFNITRAEVVTRSLNADLIRQMAQVGFKDVQIGYESLSDHLLEKIHKCNSFSSNFLYIKWAFLSGIKIRGANLIMNLLEENDADLRESLDTLRFLRFMLSDKQFIHIYSTLWIKNSSRYFPEIKGSGNLNDWKVFKSFRFLPESYIKEQNKYALQFFVKPTFNPIWDDIEEKEWSYIRNPHYYLLEETNDGNIVYREYQNDKQVVVSHLSNLDWLILRSAQEKVLDFATLQNLYRYSERTICKSLQKLKDLGILYYYEDYRNIVTIINTDCEKNIKQRYTEI